jgi:hypothetical protein
MRASEDTRERTVAALRRGYLAGRLDTDTFGLRVDQALTAGSHDELRGLTIDLPAARRPPLLSRFLARRQRPGLLALAPQLKAARLLLGRSSECDLVLGDDTVSRRHAELFLVGGAWHVRDLGSSNGTYVQGRRVIEVEVVAGDLLTLGGCDLKL